MEEYKLLKLNEDELKTLKMAILSQIVDLKIKKENSKKKEDLLVLDKSMEKFQSLLSIIMYIER